MTTHSCSAATIFAHSGHFFASSEGGGRKGPSGCVSSSSGSTVGRGRPRGRILPPSCCRPLSTRVQTLRCRSCPTTCKTRSQSVHTHVSAIVVWPATSATGNEAQQVPQGKRASGRSRRCRWRLLARWASWWKMFMVSAHGVQCHMYGWSGAGGGLLVGRELRMWWGMSRCGSR